MEKYYLLTESELKKLFKTAIVCNSINIITHDNPKSIEIPSELRISKKSKTHSGKDMEGSAWSFQLGAEWMKKLIFKKQEK